MHPDSSALPVHSILDARQLVSCWRNIGIYGDRTCPELATVVHCHNCPTYTKTARQLFDRPQLDFPSAEHNRSPLDPIATSSIDSASSDEVETSSLALFRIDNAWFSLPAHLFQQVLSTRPIRPIPHRSNPILQGLVNIHGDFLLCVSLKTLLNVEDAPQSTLSPSSHPKTLPRLILVEWEGDRWSFMVDEFQGIESIAAHQLINPPSTVLHATHAFTHSLLPWKDCTVNCLDEFLLFEALERTALS